MIVFCGPIVNMIDDEDNTDHILSAMSASNSDYSSVCAVSLCENNNMSLVIVLLSTLLLVTSIMVDAPPDPIPTVSSSNCRADCAHYHVTFMLYLSNRTDNTEFAMTKYFLLNQIEDCFMDTSPTSYHVEIFASGSNEWYTCCELVECGARLMALRYDRVIDRDIAFGIDYTDRYRLFEMLQGAIADRHNTSSSIVTRSVTLISDFVTESVRANASVLRAQILKNRIRLLPYVIESDRLNRSIIEQYYSTIDARSIADYRSLLKMSNSGELCRSIRTHHGPVTALPVDCDNDDDGLTSTTTTTVTTTVDYANDDGIRFELRLFVGLSHRITLFDYPVVQAWIVDMMMTAFMANNDSGIVYVMGPRKAVIAICNRSTMEQCAEKIMDTYPNLFQLETGPIIEQDLDFAPDILNYLRDLAIDKPFVNRRIDLLAISDFVSVELARDYYYFAAAEKRQNLSVAFIVCVNPVEVSAEYVQATYANITDRVYVVDSFGNIVNVGPGIIPSTGSTAVTIVGTSDAIQPTHIDNEDTSTTVDDSNSQDLTTTGRIWNIVIALLITESAGADNFERAKVFIHNKVQLCMQHSIESDIIRVSIIYPAINITRSSSGMSTSLFCNTSACVSQQLAAVDYRRNSVRGIAVSGSISYNDTWTEMSAITGRQLLDIYPITGSSSPIPTMYLITDYVSQPFAHTYDANNQLRTSLSQIQFQMMIVGASGEFYKYNSSIPAIDIVSFADFEKLQSADALVFCRTTAGVSAITIVAICVLGLALLLIALGILGLFRYKNRYLDWRRKILQFSVNQKQSSARYSEDTMIDEIWSISSNGDVHERTISVNSIGGIDDRKSSASICDSIWELNRNQLVVNRDERLGHGAYGIVYKGLIIGRAPIEYIHKSAFFAYQYENCEVAVKMLPLHLEDHCRDDFLLEIETMKRIGYHANLTNILGCITKTSPICLCVEYARNGDLVQYLRKRKYSTNPIVTTGEVSVEQQQQISIKELLSFAWQISNGMTYLSEHNWVHRDLAGRNILVANNKNVMISDYGLCVQADSLPTEQRDRHRRLPIKWMAPESLEMTIFSSKSDVWSFGVVLYEMFTMGQLPYDDIPPSDMLQWLRAGRRLSRPSLATNEIWQIMEATWQYRAIDRPKFGELREQLANCLNDVTADYGYLKLQSGDY